MIKNKLYPLLDYVDHSREQRKEMADKVLANPEMMGPLLEIAFEVDNKIAPRACWIIEFVVKERLHYIFPYLDFFIQNIGKLKLDSSVRPMAKICECLMISYFSKNREETKNALTNEHLENITSVCFDWLIGDYKVAAKAYSMTSLCLLGKKFEWIHPELRLVVEQNYTSGSAAYKARARMTLAKLKAMGIK